jgi:glycosyltransferase involved in cell wall biosynthesis
MADFAYDIAKALCRRDFKTAIVPINRIAKGLAMRIAMLSPVAWRTPPRHYGPWESVVSLLTEGLVSRSCDVTLFATGDSETSATLHAVCARGYEEDRSIMPKVWECLHIAELFEHAEDFDLIHNNFDFLPLTYTGLIATPVVTTIHGFSSPGILPVYKKYNSKVFYVSISDADRSPDLDYIKTIHHGIDIKQFDFQPEPDDYLLFFGRIHHDKGAKEALEIARASNKKLILAGIIQDEAYYQQHVEPHLDDDKAVYVGSAGPAQRNQLLGKACALLHPINFNEPFGLAVIESMACGTPAIAFNKGSMPELIEHGKNGFLVSDCEEAVEHVARIKDIDRSDCRRTVEDRFTVDRMVEKYLEVYTQVLEEANKDLRTAKPLRTKHQ